MARGCIDLRGRDSRVVSIDLELLVAASIAHQASEIRDRPFGTDLVEEFWRLHMKANASVGIAQLRPEEVVYWLRN